MIDTKQTIKLTKHYNFNSLTLPVPIPDEEKKLTYIFILALLCRTSEGFMKALKAFLGPTKKCENKNLS